MWLLNWTKMLWLKYAMIILIAIVTEKDSVLACDEACQTALLEKFKTALYSDFKIMLLADYEFALQNKLDPIVTEMKVMNNKLEYIKDRHNDAEIRLLDIDVNTEAASVTNQVKEKQDQLYLEVQNIASTLDSMNDRLKSFENATTERVDNIILLEKYAIQNSSDAADMLSDMCNSLENKTTNIFSNVISLEENIQNLTDETVSFSERLNSFENKTINKIDTVISLEETVIQNITEMTEHFYESFSALENESTNIVSDVTSLKEYVLTNLTDKVDSLVGNVTSLGKYVTINLIDEVNSLVGTVTTLETDVINKVTTVIEKNCMKENIISLQGNNQQVLTMVTTINEHTSELLPDLIRNRTAKIACEAPWVYLEGAGCFLFNKGEVDWDMARSNCNAKGFGSDLTILTSTTQRQAFVEHIKAAGDTGKRWWLGGNDRSGSWKWIDGQSITAGWGPNQPNDDSGDDTCLYLYDPVNNNGTLWDAGCVNNYGFICQK